MNEEITILRGPVGVGQEVTGPALVSGQGFSARYDLDPGTGVISRPSHDLYGESIVGMVLVFPSAKGGVATSWRLMDLIQRGTAPAAIIFGESNPVMVQGAALAEIPIMHRLVPAASDAVTSGDQLRVDPGNGVVEILARHEA